MQLPLDVAGGEKTCASCSHWHKVVDPTNIGQTKGECREGPPSVTLLPANGGMMQLCGYPPTGPTFPACGRYAVKGPMLLVEGAA